MNNEYMTKNLYVLTHESAKKSMGGFLLFFLIFLLIILSFFFVTIPKYLHLKGIATCEKDVCEYRATLDSSLTGYLKEGEYIQFETPEKITKVLFSNPQILTTNQVVIEGRVYFQNSFLRNQEIKEGKLLIGQKTLAQTLWTIWKGGDET